MADYIAQHSATYPSECETGLHNKVRVCPGCTKPNGCTVVTCNKCQRSIAEVAVTTTPNLFTAFILGIHSEPRFPLTISLRDETKDVIVFDDPLACAPLHFCAVPTEVLIPDWRYLLLRPREGLDVSNRLVAACHRAAKEQFISDREWCGSLLSTSSFDMQDMIMGYNYPPSQNQLHLQYIMPLLMPHQYMMFKKGVHFTRQRFFPVDFVHRCLEKLMKVRANLTLNDIEGPIEALLGILRDRCEVDYDGMHRALMTAVEKNYHKYENWKPANFSGIYTANGDSGVYEDFVDGSKKVVSAQAMYDKDKAALQNFGRSDDCSQPSLGYYSYYRGIGDLDTSFIRLR